MEPLSNLLFLLEPASLALVFSAIFVVVAAAHRSLNHERDSERHRDQPETAITLDGSQALMIPIASSCSLLLMFYLFASLSQLVTAFTAVASASSLAFCLTPYATQVSVHLGFLDPLLARIACCYSKGSNVPCGGVTRIQALLGLLSSIVVLMWLVSGHWLLNNLLGMSICIAFVCHVRLPNVKICALLLVCLFLYDIFWVFFSERIFGANVMVTVATQQAQNPVHTVAQHLRLPMTHTITKKLDLPVKLVFPRNLLGGGGVTAGPADYMMLGLGDMAIPGMLLALVLCFDYRKHREHHDYGGSGGNGCEKEALMAPHPFLSRHYKYIWYATSGYAIGLVIALAAGILTRSPQPALLYLVPSTLGPVAAAAWARKELSELWHGPRPAVGEKTPLLEV